MSSENERVDTERTPLLKDVNALPDQNASAAESGVPLPEEKSTVMLLVIMGSVWIGVFFNALDATIVATLSAPISTAFNSFTLLSWLAAAYLIANAGFQPLSGRLTDIFGRRDGLILSNVFFLAGNIICGYARNEWVMILGRVVAGIGGGCLNTISTFILSDLIPLRRRGLWQGFGNVVYGTGAGLGGVFGGWINDRWGWRWAFLIQVPFILVSAIVVFFTVDIPVKETSTSRLKRVDFLGSFTLVITLVLLLLGLNSGGNIVPWVHPLVYVPVALSSVFLAAFIYVEDRVAKEPVIPVRLLLNRTVLAGCLTNWFASMAFFSFIYYVPIYFQVRGFSPTSAGARLIPTSIGASVGSLLAGFVTRSTGRYYWLNVLFQGTYVLSAVLTAGLLDLNTPAWPPFLIFFITGCSYGSMLTITLLALISAVDHEHQAVITSASYLFRSTGSTIGISISGAVFQNILNIRLRENLDGVKHGPEIIEKLRNSIEEIKHLPPSLYMDILNSYMASLRGVFVAILGMTILSGLISLFMREHTLHKNLERRASSSL